MTWVILTLVVVALLGIAAVVIEKQRSAMLRRRFGPEYQRALDEHGDRRSAEAALRERIKRRRSVELIDLTPASAERYKAQWRAVQAGFVDDPKGSVASARTLVEQLADKWDPTQYTDEYRANLMKIIKAKMKGKTVELHETPEPRSAEVVDLMERLRQSLQGSDGKTRKTKARAKKKTASHKRKRAA